MSENDIITTELDDDAEDYRVTLDLEDGQTLECAIDRKSVV